MSTKEAILEEIRQMNGSSGDRLGPDLRFHRIARVASVANEVRE